MLPKLDLTGLPGDPPGLRYPVACLVSSHVFGSIGLAGQRGASSPGRPADPNWKAETMLCHAPASQHPTTHLCAGLMYPAPQVEAVSPAAAAGSGKWAGGSQAAELTAHGLDAEAVLLRTTVFGPGKAGGASFLPLLGTLYGGWCPGTLSPAVLVFAHTGRQLYVDLVLPSPALLSPLLATLLPFAFACTSSQPL